MIYKRDESEVTVLGEVQKYNVSIDRKNINHIVTILSSNLYSHPMLSFLRETISNAVDSHREAGSNEPILLTIQDNEISIRDYGTGISPERFQEIYLNIGSSTKRETNDYIGSFGIGRFSCLSVSNIANITSYYNGKAYYYVMNKDIDQLHIDLLFESDTTEPNGVEVKVPVYIGDWTDLKCLFFIDNIFLYSDYKPDYAKQFNERTIVSYKNFKVLCNQPSLGQFYTSYNNKVRVLIGNIPYVVDYSAVFNDSEHKVWEDTFKIANACLKIGDVDITPNRESLLYSERTKKALREAFDNCIEEIRELYKKQNSLEIEDFRLYMEEVCANGRPYLLLPDDSHMTLPYNMKMYKNPIFKKRKEWTDIPMEVKTRYMTKIKYKDIEPLARLYGDTLSRSVGRRYHRYYIGNVLDDIRDNHYKALAVPSMVGSSGMFFKDYVREKYGNGDIVFLKRVSEKITYSTVKGYLHSLFENYTPSDRYFLVQLLRETIDYLNSKVEVVDIVGSPEYEQYKKDNALPKAKRAFDGEITFTMMVPEVNYNTGNKYKTTVAKMINLIKTRHKGFRIVYAELDNPFIEALADMRYPRLAILSVSKGNLKHLINSVPSYVTPIETLYSEDNRTLRKLATILYLMDKNLHFNETPFTYLPNNIARDMGTLHKMCKIVNSSEARSILSTIPKEKYDLGILAMYNNVKKYLALNKYISNCRTLFWNKQTLYFIIRYKIIRLNFQAYKEAYEEAHKMKQLKDLLCE